MFHLGFIGTCIVIYIIFKLDNCEKVEALEARIDELEGTTSEEDFLLEWDRRHYDDEY